MFSYLSHRKRKADYVPVHVIGKKYQINPEYEEIDELVICD